MNLTTDQKTAVRTWITGGASISDVQRRLRDEFNVSLTFMETRFLIDDLGLDLKAPPKPAAPPPTAAAAASGPGAAADAELVDDGDAFAAGADEFADEAVPASGGTATVEVDRVTRPGTVVSGSVKFSDGNSGKWALDQFGRLIFEAATPGYRPSPSDLQAFQRELSAQLQRHGY